MSLFNIVRNALFAGLGAQEKVKEFIDDLVKKGDLSKSQGAKLVRAWTEKAEKRTGHLSKSLSDLLNKPLQKMNLATKNDIKELNKKIEDLSKLLKKLEAEKKE